MTTNTPFDPIVVAASASVCLPDLPHHSDEPVVRYCSLNHHSSRGSATRRIAIIGPSGAGKSTLARELGRRLNLPVIHLDRYFWRTGWVETPADEWAAQVQALAQGDCWIIDGNYRATLPTRLEAADTIIFLDLPRQVCIWRAIKRRLQYFHYPRPDIATGCDESIFDPNFFHFLRWIWDYPNRARPDVVQQLADLGPEKRVIWLNSPAEVTQFLASPLLYLPRVS